MPNKTMTTFVLDLETSGLRGNVGTRAQFGAMGSRTPLVPPRITQFALSKYEHIGDKVLGTELLIGSGPDRGYTTLLQDTIKKHGVVSPNKLSREFLEDLVRSGHYDASVLSEGEILSKQVRSHVKHLLQSGGEAKTAEQHIRSFMGHVDDALTKTDSVNVLVYNKNFDLEMINRELGYVDSNLQKTFNEWYQGLTKSGQLVMQAGEQGVQQSMFERMLAHPEYIPEYTKSKSFDLAKAAGKLPSEIGVETLEPHYALREYVDDIAKMASGKAKPEEIYAGLSEDVISKFKNLSGKSGDALAEEFRSIGSALNLDSSLEEKLKLELRTHYKRILKQKYNAEVAEHVVDFNTLDYVKSWKQEHAAKALGEATEAAHDAVDDIGTTWELNRQTNLAHTARHAREKLGEVMASTEYRQQAQQQAYRSWLADSPGRSGAVGKTSEALSKEFNRGSSWIARAAGKMGQHKGKIALAAGAAVVLLAGSRLARSLNVQHARRQYTAPFEAKLEGLRNPYSAWTIANGIQPSQYPHGNVSDFGSGRKNFQDPALGFPMHPDISKARMIFAQAGIQRKMAYSEALGQQQLIPNVFRRSDYTRDGLIDTSEWLMDMSDADTVRMRRAWVDSDVPLFGSVFGLVQRMGLKLVETVSGRDVVDQIAPPINVRLAGIDAPEKKRKYSIGQPMAEEATDIAERLMDAAAYLNVSAPDSSFGRYVGTFHDTNDRDINRNIVLWGGAMANGPQYMAAQKSAQAAGEGIFQSPFYHGIAAAQAGGADISFSQASRYKDLALGNDGGKLYSAGAWFMQRNNQMSGITDQRARNQHVFPSSRTEASLPFNMGSLFS